MTDNERQPPQLTDTDLIGAWECFKGDGFHTWRRQVLVFRRDGGRLLIEIWVPLRKRAGLRLCETIGATYMANGLGLTLISEQSGDRRVLGLCAQKDGTMVHRVPYSTAGLTYYRRTAPPGNTKT